LLAMGLCSCSHLSGAASLLRLCACCSLPD
jgi:hypothetical protein